MAEGGEAKSYPMVGGEGPQSYSRNSLGQKAAIVGVKEMICKAVLTTLDLQSLLSDLTPKLLRIADFGCSMGPNTFVAVENIIEAAELKLKQNKDGEVQFQVFFNDHASNDFNTLFTTLPSNRKYFAAGVPGSFHAPLLPNNSLHIGHISFALHWLSTVPEEAVEWNKKSIHCDGRIPQVVDAYKSQFKKDAEAFLGSRAKELVPGGLMLVLAASNPQGVAVSETLNGLAIDVLGSCLFQMAEAGLVSKEKVETFNLPMYLADVEELKEIIEGHQCFDLEFIETLMYPLSELPVGIGGLASVYRAGFEGLIEEQFGNKITDELFRCMGEELERRRDEFLRTRNNAVLFVLRRRNT